MIPNYNMCYRCDGKGYIKEYFFQDKEFKYVKCFSCGGTGKH